MNRLQDRVNADPALAAVPIEGTEAVAVVGGMPVLATPATIVTVAAGVGLIGGVAGLFGAGYALGKVVGTPSPRPQ
ncbi:hypothetical protein [Actinokineospora sp. NPDC004072]